MLYEIICDKFKQKIVRFHNGLNTVLGDEEGNNSIGKSTFLMIIDYIFGGKDYVLKSTDVQRNVGNHIFKFCFIFHQQKYYFSRDTNNQGCVNICNEEYKIMKSINLEEYQEILKDKYEIKQPYLTFRGLTTVKHKI